MFTYTLGEDAFLKILSYEDTEALFKLTDANRDHLGRWLPWVEHSRTIADTRGFIKMTLQQLADERGFQAGVWQGDQLAGVIGHNRVDSQNNQAWLGYWLGEGFQGKGLMTRACRYFMDHSFGPMGMNRVVIQCGVGNQKSRAIPERLKCQVDGTLRDGERLPSGYHDIIVYSMLRREWQNLRA